MSTTISLELAPEEAFQVFAAIASIRDELTRKVEELPEGFPLRNVIVRERDGLNSLMQRLRGLVAAAAIEAEEPADV